MLGLSSFGWGYGQRAVVATVSYARQLRLCVRGWLIGSYSKLRSAATLWRGFLYLSRVRCG